MLASVGFSKDSTRLSRLIRRFTKAPCSHAFLVVYDPLFAARMVVEASAFGIRMQSLERFSSTNEVVAISDPVEVTVGLQKLGGDMGEEYDFTGLFGMALVLLGRWLKRKWRNPWHRAHSLFCSELALRVLQDSGRAVALKDADPADCSPGDLYAALIRPAVS